MNKLRITKVYFPMVTVIKIDDGVQPRYYTSTQPGVTYPAFEVVETETVWQETLAEAEVKGARVEVEEFLLQERSLAGRPFPQTYGDWAQLAESIKEHPAADYALRTAVNYKLSAIAEEREHPEEAQEAKRWLTEKAGELGVR